MSRVLCRLADIPDGEGKGFELTAEEAGRLARGERDILVVRQGGEVLGYVNACPHTGVPLDFVEDQFMTLDKSRILCATHGAEFRVADGYCTLGPCAGQSLSPVPLRLDGDEVMLD